MPEPKYFVLLTFIFLLNFKKFQCYDDDEDWKKDPNYIFCYNTHKFDASANPAGHIYSPNYTGGEYPPDIGCNYEITAPENYVSNISVLIYLFSSTFLCV
ncbi:ovochymase-1 [Trichonephila clavipes]|nr:ovochymase-1 [Trichonephila clavipes]